MRDLVRILVGAFLVFNALAMAQEWSVFSKSWFRRSPPAAPVSHQEKDGAVGAVRMTLEIARHLYGSNGDRRFADRMPASPAVVEEYLADIANLSEYGVVRQPQLVLFETRGVDRAGPDRFLVRTREFWVTRTLERGTDVEPPRSQVLFALYRVARDGDRWRIDSWEPEEPPETAPLPAATATGTPAGAPR